MVLAKLFVNGVAITDSEVTYYTAPLKTRGYIKNAIFVNDNDTPVSITINIVPSEGSATYANRIIEDKILTGKSSWSCSSLVDQVLEPGGEIVMIASITNKIGCLISGFEIT